MPDEIEQYPEEQLRDRLRVTANAALALIPYAGGPLEILFEAVLAPSFAKRQERFIRKLGDAVAELQSREFDIASLIDNEAFVTATVNASRIAMGTHLEEKLDQLKNCLLHMALDEGRDEFLDLRLFGFVEELSPEHFVVLTYLNDPPAWFDAKGLPRPNIYMGAAMAALREARLPVEGTALEIVLRELSDKGLADTGGLGVMVSEHSVLASHSTDLGRELLAFVRDV